MALHLVVRIVSVTGRLEKRKVQKLTSIPDGEGEGVCQLLRNLLLSRNKVLYVNSTVFRLSYHILNLCNHVLGFSSETICH